MFIYIVGHEKRSTYSGKCDIVCLHLGSVKFYPVEGQIDGNAEKLISHFIQSPEYCYPGFHLGFTGCMRVLDLLLKENKFDPQEGLVVLTEFGEELLGHRRTICEIMSRMIDAYCAEQETRRRRNSGQLIKILPSEVTLKIGLPFSQERKAGHIYCNYRREPNSWLETVALEWPGEIITYTLFDELGKASPNCTAI